MNFELSELLIDIAILASVFITVMLLQSLRNILGLRLTGHHFKVTVADTPDLSVIEDLLEPLESQLAQLGFSRTGILELEHYLHKLDGKTPMLVYQSSEHPTTSVFVSYPLSGVMPNQLCMRCSSKSVDGKLFITAQNESITLLNTSTVIAQSVYEDDISKLINAHYAMLEAYHAEIEPKLHSTEDTATASIKSNLELIDTLQDEKRIVRDDDGSFRFTFFNSLKLLKSLVFDAPAQTRKQQAPESVPIARQLWLDKLHTHVFTQYEPPKFLQTWQLIITTVLSLVIGSYVFGLETAISIVIIIMIHEYGHYAMMRHYGYQQTHMMLLPLFGGIAMGREAESNCNHRLWILLMGPLPGLILGITIFAVMMFTPWLDTYSIESTDYLAHYAMLSVMINLFNLLPFGPLDGSQILNLLFPVKYYQLKGYVLTGFAVIGLAFTLYMNWYLITLLILFTFPKTSQLTANKQFIESLPQNADIRTVLERLQQQYGDPANMLARINAANQLLREKQNQPLNKLNMFFAALSLLLIPIAIGVWFFGRSLLF